MLKYLFFALMLLPMAAVAQSGAKAAKSNPKGAAFGETFKAKGAMPYDQMLGRMAGKEKLAGKVRGTVENVCQVKGCWMNIVSTQDGKEKMMVKFKDYGLFMPKDIAGREVILDGYAFYEVTSVDELRHYAEDEGKSKVEISHYGAFGGIEDYGFGGAVVARGRVRVRE